MPHLPHSLAGIVPAARPQLAALLHFWTSVRGERPMPRRADFSFEALRPWLGNVALLEPVGEPPRFRVRLAGTMIVRYVGKELTGRYVDEVFPPARRHDGPAVYTRAWRDGAPSYDEIAYDWPEAAVERVARLALPCAEDGRNVNMIVTGIYAADPRDDSQLSDGPLARGRD